MQLSAHLEDKKLTQGEFARVLGVSDAYFSRIFNGERGASLAFALRVEAATGGAVTPQELFAEIRERREKRERAA